MAHQMGVCKYCSCKHTNKTAESNFKEVGDVCFKCEGIIDFMNTMIMAINTHIRIGEDRPRRKLIIKDFVIERV